MRRIELVERFYNFSLLGSLTDMEVWIGGNDLADDDDWVWTGGEPVTGDVWGDRQDDGDCMVLLGYQWYKRECEGDPGVERAFLAQKGKLYSLLFWSQY